MSERQFKNTKELNEDNDLNNITSVILTDKEALIEGYEISHSITSLSFGDEFDQAIKAGKIPNSIKTLVFGKNFNQLLLKGDLPSSITSLSFGDNFDQPLQQGAVPPSVILLNGLTILTLS